MQRSSRRHCETLSRPCLHPALPSGVHLKALETYEVIFKIIGTKWLAKDLFIYRTDALLVKLSLLVGQQVFYGALWGSMLVTPMVRLPASVFVVTHFDRMAPLSQQTHMLGYGHGAVDPAEPSVALSAEDMTTVVSAALLTLLRRDMSLNRRLYAWLLGTDIKGGMVAPHPTLSTTMEEHTSFYFNTYSKDYLVKVVFYLLTALINILKQKEVDSDPESVISYLRPFRIIISLLDKPEIGPAVLSSVLLEVVRAFHSYCLEMLGEETMTKSGHSANQLA
ncbi:hypothetical protein XENOCAPTIV_026343, partial [Xenoophorus captivus]